MKELIDGNDFVNIYRCQVTGQISCESQKEVMDDDECRWLLEETIRFYFEQNENLEIDRDYYKERCRELEEHLQNLSKKISDAYYACRY